MQTQVLVTPTTTSTTLMTQCSQWTQHRPEQCNAKCINSSIVLQETCQLQWQSASDLPARRMMVQRMLQLSQSRSKSNGDPERAVLLAKRIELALYSRAGSLTEYCNLATLRRRLQSIVASSVYTTTSSNIFSIIDEDCIRLVFSFLEGKEIMRQRVLNRFAAAFLPHCVLTLTVEVAQLTQALASSSSIFQLTKLQQLIVHKADALALSPTLPIVGSTTTPLYAWGCANLSASQLNDGESAVRALAGALSSGTFPNLTKLQLISVFVNTMTHNALRLLCNALETGCCPLLEDLLLAGNSLADLGAYEVARLLHSSQVPHLTRLDLRRNFIGETGLRAVVSALLRTQSSLQVLCMGGNLITDNCVGELQKLLTGAVCPTLRFLGLEDNFMSADGVQFVLKTAAVSNRVHRVSSDCDILTSHCTK